MIKQETTYYDNYNIKTLSEYSEGVLVLEEEYNENGNLTMRKTDYGLILKQEYDKQNRMKRSYLCDELGNITWTTWSYSKDKMVVLSRRMGNPSVIHKIIFGPKDKNGERPMIKEMFL